MSLQNDLTPAEQAFLNSRGENAAALVAENPDLKGGYTDDKGFVETDCGTGEPCSLGRSAASPVSGVNWPAAGSCASP